MIATTRARLSRRPRPRFRPDKARESTSWSDGRGAPTGQYRRKFAENIAIMVPCVGRRTA
jgi:hypothetical protein